MEEREEDWGGIGGGGEPNFCFLNKNFVVGKGNRRLGQDFLKICLVKGGKADLVEICGNNSVFGRETKGLGD